MINLVISIETEFNIEFDDEDMEFELVCQFDELVRIVKKALSVEITMEYLVKADEYEGEEIPDFNTVKYIALSSKYELYTSSCLVDLENSILYSASDHMPVYYDYTQANVICYLSELHKEKIIKALKEANIEKWKHRYGSKNNDVVWEFGIEFNDGTVISSSGTEGSKDFPEEYDDISNVIYAVKLEAERDLKTLKHLKYNDRQIFFEIDFYQLDFKGSGAIAGKLTEEEKDRIIDILVDSKAANKWKENYGIGDGSMEIKFSDGRRLIYYNYKDNDQENSILYDAVNSIYDILKKHKEED